jgi:hypothetical protein
MIVITSPIVRHALVLKAVLTAELTKQIADAFTDKQRDEMATLLTATFGARVFRWYCIDMSEAITTVTFSNSASPRCLVYRGVPARIAQVDADRFELQLQQVDSMRPGRSRSVDHPHFIEKA